MDKTAFYEMLDIEEPAEFKYYENMAALMESDGIIDVELIAELMSGVKQELLSEIIENYFSETMNLVPDDESELYILFEQIKNEFTGRLASFESDDADSLAALIDKYRGWFVTNTSVYDRMADRYSNVRDALYDILATKFLGSDYDFDFSDSLDYDIDYYEINVTADVE